MQLLKNKFKDMTKHYTEEDRHFYPSPLFIGFPYYFNNSFWAQVAAQRMSGWDERDPENPMTWKQPNRSLMRAEFSPTNFERDLVTQMLGNKVIPQEMVASEIPGFPLPEEKRPV